jgi:hypothetical protein
MDSLNAIAELPFEADGGIAVSPDNSMTALYGDTLRILSTADYSVLYEDTSGAVGECRFSADSRKLYCVGGGISYSVLMVDIGNNYAKAVKDFPEDAQVSCVRVSPDETRWFLYRIRPNGYGIFEVYDVAADSIIFRNYLSYGYGCLEVSPDGKYAFITEAGDYLYGGGSPYLTVYDTESNRIRMMASTIGIGDGINPNDMTLGQMAVTPDSKWLVAEKAFGGKSFIGFNIERLEIDDYVEMDNHGVISPTCQNSK